jgi:hypothetical protein
MNTRARAAFLRGLGFEKSDFTLTRGALTYEAPVMSGDGNAARIRVTFLKGQDSGGGFQIMGGCVTFISGLMGVATHAAGMKHMIQSLQNQGVDVPCPTRADYGQGAYMDDLFRAMVMVNLNYDKAA